MRTVELPRVRHVPAATRRKGAALQTLRRIHQQLLFLVGLNFVLLLAVLLRR
jgi:hypothetical protein